MASKRPVSLQNKPAENSVGQPVAAPAGAKSPRRASAGGMVIIDAEECKGCGLCVEVCPPAVLFVSATLNRMGYHPAEYKGAECTGCGVCFYVCPEPAAITVYKKIEIYQQMHTARAQHLVPEK